MGGFVNGNIDLAAIHKLCRKNGLENIIRKCLRLKEWGSKGVEPEIVSQMQDSFEIYQNMSFLQTNNICSICQSNIGKHSLLNETVENQQIINRGEDAVDLDNDSSSLSESPGELDLRDCYVLLNGEREDAVDLDNDSSSLSESPGELDLRDCYVLLNGIEDDLANSNSSDGYSSVRKPKKKLYSSESPSFLSKSIDDTVIEVNSPPKRPKLNSPIKNIQTMGNKEDNLSDFDDLTIVSGLFEGKRFTDPRISIEYPSKASTSTTSASRSKWTMDESYLIFKGVKEALTWAGIKSAYFSKSARTNVHIKDRWRVILKKTDLYKELQQLFDSRSK